jgi:hypothetical protein
MLVTLGMLWSCVSYLVLKLVGGAWTCRHFSGVKREAAFLLFS